MPTISATSAAPVTVSRKRRRSADNLPNEQTSPRGISVQHVASDARQLSANDLGQFQHLFRSSRNRIGDAFQNTLRSAMSMSSATSNSTDDRNRSTAMSALLRHLPSIRIGDIQANATDRSNRNITSNMSRVERSTQQTNGANMNPNWQYLRFGNATLSELYRCAIASRGQQASDASRQNDQVRLFRRIRRNNRPNNQGGR